MVYRLVVIVVAVTVSAAADVVFTIAMVGPQGSKIVPYGMLTKR